MTVRDVVMFAAGLAAFVPIARLCVVIREWLKMPAIPLGRHSVIVMMPPEFSTQFITDVGMCWRRLFGRWYVFWRPKANR